MPGGMTKEVKGNMLVLGWRVGVASDGGGGLELEMEQLHTAETSRGWKTQQEGGSGQRKAIGVGTLLFLHTSNGSSTRSSAGNI